jgi:hypothetical protein
VLQSIQKNCTGFNWSTDAINGVIVFLRDASDGPVFDNRPPLLYTGPVINELILTPNELNVATVPGESELPSVILNPDVLINPHLPC